MTRAFSRRLSLRLLISVVLVLPLPALAYRACSTFGGSFDTAEIPSSGISVPANAPPRTLIWTSRTYQSRMICKEFPGYAKNVVFYPGNSFFTVPPATLDLSVEWKISSQFQLAPGESLRSGNGAAFQLSIDNFPDTPTFTTNINNPAGGVQSGYPGAAGPNNRPILFTVFWKVIVRKGSATTAAGIASLPFLYYMFEFDDTGGRTDHNQFMLLNLNKIVLTQPTCNVKGVSGNSIALPSVSRASLSGAGSYAGTTPFSVQLSNCSEADGSPVRNMPVRAYFEGVQIDTATGNLRPVGNSAPNVQLQLLNTNGTVLNLAGSRGSQGVNTVQIDNGGTRLDYLVRYVAVGGPAGAGPVNSNVSLTLDYP